MKKLVTIFIITFSFNCFAEKLKTQNKYIGFNSQLLNVSADNIPQDFDSNDLKPSPFEVLAGSTHTNEHIDLHLNGKISFFDFKSQILSADLELVFKLDKDGGPYIKSGLDLHIPLFTDESKYNQTQYNFFQPGVGLGIGHKFDKVDISFLYNLKQSFTTNLSQFESVETEIAHEFDNFYRVMALVNFGDFKLITEYGILDYGITTILSKEFFIRIDSEQVSRVKTGIGYYKKSFNIWLNYYSFSEFSDSIGQYYQAPYLGNFHSLSKNYLSLEFKWNY